MKLPINWDQVIATILSVAISPTILSAGATTLTYYALAAAPVAATGHKATITAL